MRKIVFCCLFVLVMMACSERGTIAGRWAMEMDGSCDTAFLMPNDTICAPELRFGSDTVYMEVKIDGKVVKRDFVGVYYVNKDEMKIVDRMGEERLCKYIIQDNVMLVSYLSDPDKIIMRLRKIEED